ncbi:hypothetical protein D3C85_1775020 [compost metagenome]
MVVIDWWSHVNGSRLVVNTESTAIKCVFTLELVDCILIVGNDAMNYWINTRYASMDMSP